MSENELPVKHLAGLDFLSFSLILWGSRQALGLRGSVPVSHTEVVHLRVSWCQELGGGLSLNWKLSVIHMVRLE